MIGKIKQDSNIRIINGWREKVDADNYVELTKTFSFPSVSTFTTLAGGFGAYQITNINIPANLKDGYSVSVVDAKVANSFYGALTAKNEQIANSGNNWAQTTTEWEQSKYIKNTGGGEPHNNMPPYLAVYMWTRIE